MQKHTFNLLVKRKNSEILYTAKLHTHSKKFELNTGEKITYKKFHHLFEIMSQLTNEESEKYFDMFNKDKRVFNANWSYYINPLNGFKVRLNHDDPRVKFYKEM